MYFSRFTLASLQLLLVTILLQSCWLKPLSQLSSNPTKEETGSVTHTSSLSQEQNSLLVAEIARQVTVRILTESGSGSGVVIARQGQTYTVLTCHHVVQDSKTGYGVLSADGKTYAARLLPNPSLAGVDLALVQFESKISYRVVELGDSRSLETGAQVYAAGFPNYHFINQNNLEETRDWGTKAFRLTTGKVSLLLERSLPQGYRLGYTNEVEVGMSGGPVLNQMGKVVGINGRLKYPVQGIEVFTFADGTKPSEKLFQQMEALSWAIPVTAFQHLAQKRGDR